MFQDKPAWIAHQRKRWLRPNWRLWMRPDAERWLDPKAKLLARLQRFERKDDFDVAARLELLLRLKRELVALAAELKFRRLLRKAGFNPDQPRVPAGNPDGGQWTSDGGGSADESASDRVRFAEAVTGTLTDADGRPYYRPGGHHEMPEAVYKKWDLDPEMARVFKQSSTGPLGATFRTTPDGPRIGNVWDGEGGLHRAYNDAVEELSLRFIERNGLRPDGSNMSPDHARAIVKAIRETEDPRIRDFNLNMRRIQRFRRLRGGADD